MHTYQDNQLSPVVSPLSRYSRTLTSYWTLLRCDSNYWVFKHCAIYGITLWQSWLYGGMSVPRITTVWLKLFWLIKILPSPPIFINAVKVTLSIHTGQQTYGIKSRQWQTYSRWKNWWNFSPGKKVLAIQQGYGYNAFAGPEQTGNGMVTPKLRFGIGI